MKLLIRSALVLLASFSLASLSFGADASSLKLPPGVKVAVVMFEDLECPDCARSYPIVNETAKAHKVQVLLHDFPLPIHHWSYDAAVYARYFDTRSQQTGNDFRAFMYQNQRNVTRENLRQFVQKFADDNKVPLPFNIDPDGKLKAKVQADYELGQRINVEHTPTIFVLGHGTSSTPFVEVVDRDKLSQYIEDMQKQAGSAAPATVKRAATKGTKKKPS